MQSESALKVKFKGDELHAVRNSNIKHISAHPTFPSGRISRTGGAAEVGFVLHRLWKTHKICGSGVGLYQPRSAQALEILQKSNTPGISEKSLCSVSLA